VKCSIASSFAVLLFTISLFAVLEFTVRSCPVVFYSEFGIYCFTNVLVYCALCSGLLLYAVTVRLFAVTFSCFKASCTMLLSTLLLMTALMFVVYLVNVLQATINNTTINSTTINSKTAQLSIVHRKIVKNQQ
jgi:hypothetical protein